MSSIANSLEAQSHQDHPQSTTEAATASPQQSRPPRDQEWAEGSAPRTSGSRRRKPAGHGHNTHNFDFSGLPAAPAGPVAPEAPEPPPAPKGPPISYRDPYVNGMSNARSFADRARDLADEGTHLPSGRTPEPTAAVARDHTPWVQSVVPEVMEPHAAVVEQNSHPLEPEKSRQQAPVTAAVQTARPGKAQASRVPLDDPPAQTRSAPRKDDRERDREPEQPADAPTARMGSVRGNPGSQKIGWAVDHSPLQRLEVKLNDMSKEEKRARVQIAEQRAREKEKAMKQRESQHLDAGDVRGSKPASSANDARPRRKSMEKQAINEVPLRGQSNRRVVSESYAAAATQTTPRSEQPRASRIPRPVEAAAIASASGATAYGVARSVSQPQAKRVSLDSAGPRMADTTTRQYNAPTSAEKPDRRRSVDERGVRFHPFDESMSKNNGATSQTTTSLPPQQTALFAERLNNANEPAPAHANLAHKGGPKYEVPPQTVAGGKARQLLGFGGDYDQIEGQASRPEPHHRFVPHLHRHQQTTAVDTGPQVSRHLDEWRSAGTAVLLLTDLTAQKGTTKPGDKGSARWDSPSTSQRRNSRASSQQTTEIEYFDGANEDANQPTLFDPPLYMKCGPLLRYKGLKREKLAPPAGAPAPERELWRGSVMIVTVDQKSMYEPAPTLRLFHQPMDLLPPLPTHAIDGDEALPYEYVDPVAGMPKISRDGSTVYLKPAEDFEDGVDYSRDETDNGLYEKFRTANVPTGYGRPNDGGGESPISRPTAATRRAKTIGRFREIKGIRLHAEKGVTFWRFNLEVELGDKQARIAYRINKGASVGFWVPARGKSMNIMFHSCNGFSASVKPEEFGGPDPLWRDVMNAHQTKPFHVMIGGGDQVYNDRVTTDTRIFQDWLEMKNPVHKREAPFTAEMRDELEDFYLNRYAMWFSQGLFGMANSQIPMVNIWDDHDIIDGFGSYPHSFMSSPVFCGLGSVAFKYYMLFQHQSVPDELESDEPSWLLGSSPGPYINYLSRNVFMSLGKHVSFLGLDCRTERMREEILSEHTYDKILERCRREIRNGETKHLIVLLGVPIAYPRLEWLESILTSRAMDPLKALSRLGVLGNLTNKFDGGYEILDDLDDHWTAKHHKDERKWLIEELQDLAAEKSVRITILGGDVHLAAIGQFYSNKNLGVPKDQDHRYMPNIVSSAIVNTPPTDLMADFITRRDKKIHHLDDETDEDMIPMFTHDVDGKRRNNKKLLPRRNWCSISEYNPGETPPHSPAVTPSEPQTPMSQMSDDGGRRKSFSLGNSKPAQLLRRLSMSNRDNEKDMHSDDDLENDSYFPPTSGSARKLNKLQRNSSAPPIPTRPVSQFHRRPTNLSEMAAKKGSLPDRGGEISLEGGLDIRLNCEIKKGDPIGSTESYRLLVPALWYTGASMPAQTHQRPGMLKRLSSLKANPFARNTAAHDSYSDVSETGPRDLPPFQARPQTQSGTGPPAGTVAAAAAMAAIPSAASDNTHRDQAAAFTRSTDQIMGYSVSVESLPKRPRRQSLVQRIGSLKDKIPGLNRQKHMNDSHSEVINDEYTPNDDAAMMKPGGMARQSRPPIAGSMDSVTRKPRRPSITQRFGSIGRRLSQMGRRKEQDWYSETGSYTGSETGSESDHESDWIGSGDLTRPGRQPMTAAPGSRGQPTASPPTSRGNPTASPVAARAQPGAFKAPSQQRPSVSSAAPARTASQRTAEDAHDEIPDPFKARPRVAISPPPILQQAQYPPPGQSQYTATYSGSTDAVAGTKQPVRSGTKNTVTQRSSSQRVSSGYAHDSRRSGGVYPPPEIGDETEDEDEEEDEDSELDSIDELDSLKAAHRDRQKRKSAGIPARPLSGNVPQQSNTAARSASLRGPATGPSAGLHKKDISKFFGETDPAVTESMRRRVTDPGSRKRDSGGYDGVDAFNGKSKKWWKLGK